MLGEIECLFDIIVERKIILDKRILTTEYGVRV